MSSDCGHGSIVGVKAPALTPPQVILASSSPRRHDLLAQLGIPFTVRPANIEEDRLPDEAPHAYVLRVAKAKAQHLAYQFPAALVLGADTTVVLGRQILGKPAGVEAARRMLAQLSGRTHTVITGLAVLHSVRQFACVDSVTTRVRFRRLSEAEIERYVATEEPFGKAGAYAIQGQAAAFVTALEGCYTNVVGLPLQRTAALLQAAGLQVKSPEHSGKNSW